MLTCSEGNEFGCEIPVTWALDAAEAAWRELQHKGRCIVAACLIKLRFFKEGK